MRGSGAQEDVVYVWICDWPELVTVPQEVPSYPEEFMAGTFWEDFPGGHR